MGGPPVTAAATAATALPRFGWLTCPCGCGSHWRREPGHAPRLVDAPACMRHVADLGAHYRAKVDVQRRAEGRAA